MNYVVRTDYLIHTEKHIQNKKIVCLSDIHYGAVQFEGVLEKTIEKINNENPDIVILDGDIVEERTSKNQMKYVFQLLGKIKNREGIYFVYGNHDILPYTDRKNFTVEEMEKEIKKNGIKLLKDSSVFLDGNFVLVGRDDKGLGYSSSRTSIHDLLLGIPEHAFVIVADHQPDDYAEVLNNGVDLMLSGHTHAGQIFPLSFIYRHFGYIQYGIHPHDSGNLIITSGEAGYGYNYRTEQHCEYTVIRVLPEK